MDDYMILVLLLQTIHISFAQTDGPTASHDSINSGFSTTTGSIFAALLAIFVLIAFFSVYYNRCMYGRTTSHTTIIRPSTTSVATTAHEPEERNNRRGLDQSVIETFPIMEYAAIKALSTIKRPLECAVCLSEFANDDSLRLLPGCYHVFHPDCIDKWLESHVTCPVCRADLTKPSLPSNESSITSVTDVVVEEQITDGHAENQDHNSSVTNGLERFTLRLPDHVRREIEDARRHRRSVSMAGYAFERRESGRSGRLWGFVKSFSFRRRTEAEVGEGSFKRVFPLAEGAGAPASNRSVAFIGSGSGESQSEDTHASEMTVLDRV